MSDTQQQLPEDDSLIAGGKVMSLLEHLTELRGVLVRSGFFIFIFFCIALAFANDIIAFLKMPLADALPEGAQVLHFTGPMDVFTASVKVAFLAAVVCACPIWIYQFWRFLEPGLYPRERKYILPFVVASVGLFFSGVGFCFFVMAPITMKFLIGLGMEVGTPIITVNDYISLLTILIFGFGFIFETPVILILLAMLDIISAEMLAQNRRFVIVIILIVAAVLTPPDPISQVAMAVPVYLMYEAAIVIIRLIKRKSEPRALQVTK